MKYLLAIIMLSLACGLCKAGTTSDKARELNKLLDHLGYGESFSRLSASVVRIQRHAYAQANLPSEVWDDIERELRSDEIRKICAKLYDEALTLEEIKAANAFYESDLGRSYARKVSEVGEREFYAAREWAGKKVEAVLLRYRQQAAKASEVPTPLPHVWTDEKTGDKVAILRLPAAPDSETMRNQAGGFIEGALNSGYFIPQRAGETSFAGLPALSMRGRAVADGREGTVIFTIAFAKDCSYLITAISENEPSTATQEAEILETAEPREELIPVVKEIGSKLRDSIGELAEEAKKIVAARRVTK
ncbi:hypothetical protein M2447_000706 [Ereboglobus sp. PH5-10]|uniref:DUF2059 domain-containing protein n=1 Tax=Ereboglobus sp. PH5-10 TaxID=2940629 RepID=UPI002406B7CB|nr:DUF2059 domain-containing protein [Ereboglobus sp. PH5-10]MDF9826624.1 hypothetical protein [Ereboglobus sp. PH5-10]